MNNQKSNSIFAKNLSTVFIVASPFQLMCAIEAIYEFEIKSYKFVFCLVPGWGRNNQMFEIAKARKIDYDIIDYGSNTDTYFDIQKGQYKIECTGLYDRIFIGDFFQSYYFFIVPIYARKGAVVGYIDDGNDTILFLKGIEKEHKPANLRAQLHWYRNLRYRETGKRNAARNDFCRLGICDSKAFFTIFNNIQSKLFAIHPNTFSHLIPQKGKSHLLHQVIVIGTCMSVYAEEVAGIRVSLLESILWDKLCNLRKMYPKDEIFYVPHPRDDDQYIPSFCKLLNIKYEKIYEPIEMYCINNGIEPIAIVGMRSNAHVALKRIYPTSEVTFWHVASQKGKDYNKIDKVLMRYYNKCGIKNEEFLLDDSEFLNKSNMLDNIKSLFRLIFDKITRYKYAKK